MTVLDPKCLVLQPIHASGMTALAALGVEPVLGASPDAAALGRAVAIVTRNAPVPAAMIDAAPHLRVIAKHGAGLDAIDVAHASAAGIAVVYTPGANARGVAEQALAMMLALLKNVRGADAAVRAGDFGYKFRTSFRELSGRTLGLVGFGEIGRILADMARGGFGMRVLAYSPSVPDDLFRRHGVERCTDFHDLLRRADVVSLHAPPRPGGPRIDAAALAAMRPDALLVNTGRGELVDEAALVEALAGGRLAGAGLDVFSSEPLPAGHPLLGLDNVILSPHVAGTSDEALVRMAEGVAAQVGDVLAGRRPPHLANPEMWDRRRQAV